MKFSDRKKQFNKKIESKRPSVNYYRTYLNSSFVQTLEDLDGKYVYHLFSDLAEMNSDKNFEKFLQTEYRHSDDYAKDCLELAFKKSHLFGLKVKSWTDSALKCFDIFILKLIQDVLGENIPKVHGLGVEREKYYHLTEKEDNYKIIGSAFDTIYQQRNEFIHVEVIEEDGRRRSRPISNKRKKKYRKIILKNFKEGLVALEEEIPADGG